jgi:hypothetical protein
MKHSGNLGGGAFIADCKLLGGGSCAAGALQLATPHGLMELIGSLPGVASRFGMAARAHHREPKRRQSITERSWFTSAEHDSNLRKGDPKSAQELGEIAVVKRKSRLKFSSRRP